MKRQTTNSEEIFANHLFDNGSASSTDTELSKFNHKRRKNPTRKWAKQMKRHVTQEDNADGR